MLFEESELIKVRILTKGGEWRWVSQQGQSLFRNIKGHQLPQVPHIPQHCPPGWFLLVTDNQCLGKQDDKLKGSRGETHWHVALRFVQAITPYVSASCGGLRAIRGHEQILASPGIASKHGLPMALVHVSF